MSFPLTQRYSLAGVSLPERQATRARLQMTHDQWWLGAILVERFVTRFVSARVPSLSGWANFLDYPLLVLFGAYVLLTIRDRPALKVRTGFGPLTLAFVLLIGISALANLDRLHPGAFTLFVVNFLEPLAYMALAYALAPRPPVATFLVKVLLLIGWLQIAVVGIVDLPVFLAQHNPDMIVGTFTGNPYQLTFFLLTWNILILSRLLTLPSVIARWASVLAVQTIILVIFLLAQFRSILPFAVFTWGLTYLIVSRHWVQGILAAVVGLVLLGTLFSAVNVLLPELRWQETLQLTERSDETVNSGKVQAVLNYGSLVADQPQVLLIGTGPGTYTSRGFRTFSMAGRDDVANRLYRNLFHTDYYTTDVAQRYVLPVINLWAFGSATAAVPWFSYLSLPAELGVPGLLLVLAMYFKAIANCWKPARQPGDLGLLARWVLIALILLLQMGFLENWLEVSRLTVPIWTMFGVLLAQIYPGHATVPRTAAQGSA